MDNKFEPNEEILNQMTSMGIPQTVAIQVNKVALTKHFKPNLKVIFKALFCTGNKSIDEAVDYVYSTQEEINDFNGETNVLGQEITGILESENVEDEEDMQYYKMIFVVNTSLKMGVGKIAAQVRFQ